MMQITEPLQEGTCITTVLGITTIILGLLALFAPMLSGLSASIVVALLLIAAGMAQSIFAFAVETSGKGVPIFLFGGLSMLAGGTMLIWPGLGFAALTLLLVAYFLVGGIFEIIIAFRVNPQKAWAWLVVSGVPAIVLAGLIGWQWMLSAAWAIDALVGIRLLFTGWWMIMIGSSDKDGVSEVKHSANQKTDNRMMIGCEANSPPVPCTGQRLIPG